MKPRGLLYIFGGILSLISIGVAFGKPISLSSMLFRLRASDLSNLSVTFNSSGTQSHTDANTYYRSATTSLGNTFYLRNVTRVAPGASHVAVMSSMYEQGSVSPEITFTTTNTGTTLFEFKNIKGISATSNSATSRTLTVFKSSDGTNWTDGGSLVVNSSGGTNTDVKGANYIKITYPSGTTNVYLTNFTIYYSCSDGPDVKTVTSISLSGQTTEFIKNGTFAFDGVVTAYYSDLTSATVSPTSISSPDMSTTGVKEVTVSYTEEGVTQTASYNITVSSTVEVKLNGTYNYTSRSVHTDGTDWTGCMTLTFTNAGKCTWRNVRGTSIVYDCKVFFDYVAINDGTQITLTMTVCEGEWADKFDYRMNGNSTSSASAFAGDGGLDRPANKGITVDGAGNEGKVSLDKSTVTVNVYQYANSKYSYYDTFTFTLAN